MLSTQPILTIDRAAIAANYRFFKNKVAPGCRVAGVLKADGYGLGMIDVLPAFEAENCPFYFVAALKEAINLRAHTAKPIAVLGGGFADEIDIFVQHNLIPVLNDVPMIEDWRAGASRLNRKLPVIVHFDTGMNRLGLNAADAEKLLADPHWRDGLDLKLIMSHFACADDLDHPLTQLQYEIFNALRQKIPDVPASLANSSGIMRNDTYHFDLVRPGMALYGLNPTPEIANPMRPVVNLQVPVLQVRAVKAGEPVGYSSTYTTPSDTTLATVALGYADGFLRSLSGKGILYFNGKPCPIRGRVSMDLTIVEIGELPVRPGMLLEVLGPHQDADTLAAAAGTIGYEILTSLGARYRRVYRQVDQV